MATTLKSNRKSHGKSERPAEKTAPPEKKEKADERPIWETVVELGSQIADEDWAKVSNDSSINYKHHLYGSPIVSH